MLDLMFRFIDGYVQLMHIEQVQQIITAHQSTIFLVAGLLFAALGLKTYRYAAGLMLFLAISWGSVVCFADHVAWERIVVFFVIIGGIASHAAFFWKHFDGYVLSACAGASCAWAFAGSGGPGIGSVAVTAIAVAVAVLVCRVLPEPSVILWSVLAGSALIASTLGLPAALALGAVCAAVQVFLRGYLTPFEDPFSPEFRAWLDKRRSIQLSEDAS